jgi:hypothetical protein
MGVCEREKERERESKNVHHFSSHMTSKFINNKMAKKSSFLFWEARSSNTSNKRPANYWEGNGEGNQ